MSSARRNQLLLTSSLKSGKSQAKYGGNNKYKGKGGFSKKPLNNFTIVRTLIEN